MIEPVNKVTVAPFIVELTLIVYPLDAFLTSSLPTEPVEVIEPNSTPSISDIETIGKAVFSLAILITVIVCQSSVVVARTSTISPRHLNVPL